MNEYGLDMPLWLDILLDMDVEDLDLSDDLRHDLRVFAERWDDAIDPEVFDDRWDGVPGMDRLVRLKYSLDRALHPQRQRARREEHEAIRRTGEALAIRVQDELGPAYRVKYVH